MCVADLRKGPLAFASQERRNTNPLRSLAKAMAEWKRKLEATDAADDTAKDEQKGEKEQDSARDLGAAPSARHARAHARAHTHTHTHTHTQRHTHRRHARTHARAAFTRRTLAQAHATPIRSVRRGGPFHSHAAVSRPIVNRR
jgi:hypothetical protein